MGGEISLIHLHSLDPVYGRVEGLALLDGDDPVLANFFHRICDDVANFWIVVGCNTSHLSDLGLVLDLGRHLSKAYDDSLDRFLYASLQAHRISSGCDIPQTFMENCTSENGCSGGAVTGVVRGPGRNLFHHLRSHVLEGVLEFDLTRNSHTVFGDRGSSE